VYGDALDALRGLLRSNFPAVNRIYVSTMPKSFIRPSFFINLANSYEEHINRDMYQADMTWQIVYFAPMDSKGQADVFNQLSVSSTLKKALMEAMVVTGPSGIVYHIIEAEGGPRDAEVYITVDLQAEATRPRPEYDLIAEVIHEQEG
jgi:hypothetical protein